MARYRITAPDGNAYEITGPENATQEELIGAVQQHIASKKPPVETAGLGEALKGGAKQFGRTFGTGVVGAFAPEEAARRSLIEAEQARAAGEKPATSLEAVRQKYLESGFFPAAGEALSQIPGAIAEQLPNLAATAAGARLGAMAGAPLGLPGVIGGGVLGAATPSLIQSFGQNIARQAEEQRAAIEAGAAPDISRGAAAAAAVPQAALDVAAQRLIFGKQLVARVLGRTPEEIAKLEGKALVAAERKAEKIAKEGLAKTLSRGVATGVIGEVPTEVAQQMLERAQAGLPLFDDEAKQEYLESAYGAALVSPLGAVGSISERGAAREGVAAREAQRQLAEQRLTQLATGVGGVGENYAAQQALIGQYDTLSRTRAELKERKAELEKTGNRIGLLDVDEQLDALDEQEKQLQEQAKELNVPLTPSPAYAGPRTIEAEIADLEKQYGKAKTVEDRAKLRDQLRAAYARLEQLTAPEEVPAAEGFTAPEPKKRGKKGAKAATPEGEVAEAGAEAVEEPVTETAGPLVGPVIPARYTPEYGEMLVQKLQKIETETQRPKGVGMQAEKNRQANLFGAFNTLLEDARNLEFSKTDEDLAEDLKDGASYRLENIQDYLNTLKERFIESATDEIRLAREEAGVAPISDKELSDVTDKLDQLLTEIANRTATPNFNKRQGEAVDPEQERFNFSVAERRRLVKDYGLDERVDQQLALLTREINKLSQQAAKFGATRPGQATKEALQKLDVDLLEATQNRDKAQAELDTLTGVSSKASFEEGAKAREALMDAKARVLEVNAQIDKVKGGSAEQEASARAEKNAGEIRRINAEIDSLYKDRADLLLNNLRAQLARIKNEAAYGAAPRPSIEEAAAGAKAKAAQRAKEEEAREAAAYEPSPVRPLPPLAERQAQAKEADEADQRRLETLLSPSAKTSTQVALDNINSTIVRGYLINPKRKLGTKGQIKVLKALKKRKAELEKKLKEEEVVKAPESGKKGLSPLAEAKRVTRLGLAENIKKVRKILFSKTATPKEKAEARATLKDLRSKIKKGAISYEAAVPKLMQAGRELAKLKKRGSEIQQILSAQSENARKRSALLADAAQARREGRTDEAAALVAERKELEKKLPNVAKLQAEFDALTERIRLIERPPATKEEEREIGAQIRQVKVPKWLEKEAFVEEPVDEIEELQAKQKKAKTPSTANVAGVTLSDIKFTEEPDNGQAYVPELTAKIGKDLYSVTGTGAVVELSTPVKTDGSVAIDKVVTREDGISLIGKVNDKNVQVGIRGEGKIRYLEVNNFWITTTDRKPRSESAIRRAIGDTAVDAFLNGESSEAVAVKVLKRDLSAELKAVSKAFENQYFVPKAEISKPRKVTAKRLIEAVDAGEVTELTDFDDAEIIREAIGGQFSMDADGNVFRRGSTRTPVAEAEAKATIDKVKVPKGVKFEYAYTYDALPDSVKAQLQPSTDTTASVSFGKTSGSVSNESVIGGLRLITEDDDIAFENSDRVGAVLLTGLDRQAGGAKGRASDVLKALTNWADNNNKKLVLMPSASGDLKQPELINWYARNGFVKANDGAMERSPKKIVTDIKGAVLPDGTVVIIGNAHSNTADIQKTIAHEVVGHYGVDVLLGPKGMKDLTDRTMRMQGGIQKLAESFGKDVGEATLSTAIYYQRMADQARADGNEKRAKELEELGKIQAMRELIAHVEETRPTAGFVQKANRFIKELVGYVRAALRKMGLLSYDKVSTSDIYKLLRDARKAVGSKTAGVYVSPTGEIAFSKDKAVYAATVGANAQRATAIVGANRAGVRDVLGSNLGLQFVTRFVDRFAPLERVAAFMKDSAQATQMMYFLRMHDQGIAWTQAALTKGPLKIERDAKGYLMIKAEDGPNVKDMVEALKDAKVGNPEATKQLFTAYLLAERAEIVGYDKLKSDLGDKVNKADLKAVLDLGRNNAAFQKAKKIYNDHNNGLLDFLVETGAMSKEVAQNLRNKSYVPYYREDKDGNVEMVLGGEKPISVGNVKDQPYLHELVGGNKNIIDVFASSIQNTRLLTDMALRNLATRNAAFGLQSAGMLKDNRINNGSGPAAKDVIRFKIDGEEKYAVVDSDKAGIPAELLVSGMEGVKVMMPLMVRMLSAPAGILRKFITRNPVYAMRQLVRDSTTNYFLTGADVKPLGSAAANFYKLYANKKDGSMPDLQSRGIISGNVLTGTSEQMEDILLNMVSGKPGWEQYMAKLDIMAQRADESSRISIYNDFRKQGLSDMEATMATLESMNFNKRGTSPSIFMLNAMVPFLNAQIQGLNVLAKSLRGTMPFAERLKQRKKLVNRAMFMVATTAAYALMMSDDEAYENSDPVDRYNNWFVRVPGLDEPVRVPIPFEVGLLFKAIPEAMIDAMRDDAKAEQAYEGMKRLFANSMPIGPSSLPAGIKPIIELTLGSSFYTGLPIESEREKRLLPEYRTREKTTEISKAIGSMLGVSPIQLDYLINGYFSGTGLAIAGLGNFMLRSPDAPQPAEKTLSEMPVIGALFQTNTGAGYVNTFYRQAEQIEQAKATFDALIKKGDADGAARIVETSANDIAMDGFVSSIKQQLADIREAEKLIRNSDIDPKEKAKTIKDLRISAAQLAKAANLSVSALQ